MMANDAPLKKKRVNFSGSKFLFRLGSIKMDPALLLDDVMDCDIVLLRGFGVFSLSESFPLSSSFILLKVEALGGLVQAEIFMPTVVKC